MYIYIYTGAHTHTHIFSHISQNTVCVTGLPDLTDGLEPNNIQKPTHRTKKK